MSCTNKDAGDGPQAHALGDRKGVRLQHSGDHSFSGHEALALTALPKQFLLLPLLSTSCQEPGK